MRIVSMEAAMLLIKQWSEGVTTVSKKTLSILTALLVLVIALGACAAPATTAPAEPAAPAAPAAPAEQPAAASSETTSTTEVTATAATTETAGAGAGMRFAFSGSELANPWVIMVGQGFDAACKELGLECVSLNAGSDVGKQVTDIENVIQGGYKGVVFNPIDGNALESVLNQATADGIATITIAQIAPAATAGIELDDYAYGTVIATNAAEWINSALGGKGTLAILAEDNIESSIRRGDAIADTIAKLAPGITIVARQQANTPEQGLSVTENLLIQHPDLNVIVAANDSGGIGAYQAFENAGLATDPNRAIFSGDNTAEAAEYIKIPDSVYRGTADLYPYESGYKAVYMAYDYLTKGFPKEHVSIPLGMGPVTKEDLMSGK